MRIRLAVGLALMLLGACLALGLPIACLFRDFPSRVRIAMLGGDVLGDLLALVGFMLWARRTRRTPHAQREEYRGRWEPSDIAPLVTLLVLVKFFTVASPQFFSVGTATAILQQGSALAIVAAGLTYVLLCGEIDLAVGTLAIWAACSCGWLFRYWAGGTEPEAVVPAKQIAAVIAAPLATCVLLGLVSGGLAIWSRMPTFIISLAMMFIAEGMARYLTKTEMQRLPDVLGAIGNDTIPLEFHIGRYRVFGGLALPYSAVLAAAVFLLGHFVLRYTRFGRYVYATGGNRAAARLNGIRTSWIVMSCMAISALAAGLGGLVAAGRLKQVTLDQNKDLLLQAVACVVLGGTSLLGGEGGIRKTLVGVVTFMVLIVGLDQINWVHDLARQLLTGLVLMTALVINGLLAKRR